MKPDAERLARAREHAGLSVMELAAKLHVQPAYIYSLESGKRGAGVDTLRKYVEAGLLTAEQALGIEAA